MKKFGAGRYLQRHNRPALYDKQKLVKRKEEAMERGGANLLTQKNSNKVRERKCRDELSRVTKRGTTSALPRPRLDSKWLFGMLREWACLRHPFRLFIFSLSLSPFFFLFRFLFFSLIYFAFPTFFS